MRWNKFCRQEIMETLFQISLHIKTPSGFETYGTFDLGRDREQAMDICKQLKGTPDIALHSVLYMDLSELKDGLPLPLEIRHCTLEDIAYNARIITWHVFKNLSL